jgi:hypothetical protein
LLSRQDALRFYKATVVLPVVDSLGADPLPPAGVSIRYRAALAILETEGGGEERTLLAPTDIRARLGSPPDKSIVIEETNRDGSVPADSLPSVILGTSSELSPGAMGILSVIRIQHGAPPNA